MDNKIKIRLRLVIIKEDKLLAYYDSIDDYYFYIGGKLEFGETIEDGWKREIKEELGDDVEFTFKKILYVRDFFDPDNGEQNLELFILGDINKFEELEHKLDAQHEDGSNWLTWLDINNLPENLYPKSLSKKLLSDFTNSFPNAGEYIGRLDPK